MLTLLQSAVAIIDEEILPNHALNYEASNRVRRKPVCQSVRRSQANTAFTDSAVLWKLTACHVFTLELP